MDAHTNKLFAINSITRVGVIASVRYYDYNAQRINGPRTSGKSHTNESGNNESGNSDNDTSEGNTNGFRKGLQGKFGRNS